MMKANELMIGDLVFHTDVKSVHKLEATDFVTWKSDGMYSKEDLHYEAIPLTPEILKKNGYIKINVQRYEIGEYESDFYVKINPNKRFVHINGKKNNANLYNCTYIHELQHALRLCELNELADELKI